MKRLFSLSGVVILLMALNLNLEPATTCAMGTSSIVQTGDECTIEETQYGTPAGNGCWITGICSETVITGPCDVILE